MKTEEDEAFDEIAKRQGGGFKAKQAMAAEQHWNEEEWNKNHWRCGHGWLRGEQCEICNAPLPTQEPAARVTGTYGGRFTYEPINPAIILPVGMALYAGPQRTWVGLTDEEIAEIRLKSFDSIATNRKVYEAIEAKLKEKNNG